MAPKPKYDITKEILEELHISRKMTPNEIADQIGCDYSLITYYLKKFGIEKLPKYERIEGQRFGRLKVIKLLEVKNNNATWECLCDCGNIVHATTGRLKFGSVRSCGCLLKETLTTHGMTHTRPYRIWLAMKSRCTNKKQPNYKQYGEKGITYAIEWDVFENFWQDMRASYKDGLSLERIDNEKGYSNDNCRWATPSEQNRNMHSNVIIKYNDLEYCITDLATEIGVPRARLYYYHRKGLRGDELIKQVLNTMTSESVLHSRNLTASPASRT